MAHPQSSLTATTRAASPTIRPLDANMVIVVAVTLVLLARREFVLLLPALVACHYVLIGPEERYLAARFGEEYCMYAASVHRWIGRARRPG